MIAVWNSDRVEAAAKSSSPIARFKNFRLQENERHDFPGGDLSRAPSFLVFLYDFRRR